MLKLISSFRYQKKERHLENWHPFSPIWKEVRLVLIFVLC